MHRARDEPPRTFPPSALGTGIWGLHSFDHSIENGARCQRPSTARRWEPTPRWERRYREVLDAAATVFAEKGYAGASTRDIADRLGIRQASLYYYFPSKEAALAAICELGVKDFIANLQTIIGEPTRRQTSCAPPSPIIWRRCGAARGRLHLRLPAPPPRTAGRPAPGGRCAGARLSGADRANVRRGHQDREFRAELDPQLATLALLGLCNSVITNRGVPRSSTIDAMIEEYARIVIGGVVARARQQDAAAVMTAPKTQGSCRTPRPAYCARRPHLHAVRLDLRAWEYTDWIDESMSWKDTLYIGDWSPLAKMRVKGRDALKFFSASRSTALRSSTSGRPSTSSSATAPARSWAKAC